MKELQNGRSMIEMLGVLAIIGVLSIGGLAGYTMAMNRNRANNIAEYISRCAVVAQTSKGTGARGDLITGSCNSDVLGEAAPAGITDAVVGGDLDETTITLTWAEGSAGAKTAFTNRYTTDTGVNPHIKADGSVVYFFAS